MKIKIHTRFASLENQGQGRITMDIINGLKERGHKILINESRIKSNYGYLYHSLFGKMFDIRKCDVNIASSSMDTFYLNPDKSIVIIHDLIPVLQQFTTLTHYNNSPINQIGSLSFFYFTLRKAIKFKKIICISEKTKKELLSIFRDLDENKIIVLNNSVQDKYKPQKIIKKDKLRLYTVSALDHRKRTIELIKWFNKWKPKDVELYIGGKGSLLEEARFLAKDNSNLHILGEIPEEDMVRRYAESDIVLFPTKNEGFGLPIIEAANCDRPVITLEDGAIPEEVKECSIIAKDWNDMKKIILELKDISFRNKISAKLLNKAKKFKFDYGEKIENVIKSINNK